MEQWYIKKSSLFKTASPKQILDFDDYFDTVLMIEKMPWRDDSKSLYFYIVTRKQDVRNVRRGEEVKIAIDTGNGNRYQYSSRFIVVDTNATGNQKLPIYYFA